MPRDIRDISSKVEEVITNPEDVLDQAIKIAKGEPCDAPLSRAHLLVLCLQCEIHRETNEELRRRFEEVQNAFAEVSRQLAEARKLRSCR